MIATPALGDDARTPSDPAFPYSDECDGQYDCQERDRSLDHHHLGHGRQLESADEADRRERRQHRDPETRPPHSLNGS